MEWGNIEKAGREKYNLSDEWHLNMVNARDPEVIEVEFTKKGPRGGWLEGKGNSIKGYLVKENIK